VSPTTGGATTSTSPSRSRPRRRCARHSSANGRPGAPAAGGPGAAGSRRDEEHLPGRRLPRAAHPAGHGHRHRPHPPAGRVEPGPGGRRRPGRPAGRQRRQAGPPPRRPAGPGPAEQGDRDPAAQPHRPRRPRRPDRPGVAAAQRPGAGGAGRAGGRLGGPGQGRARRREPARQRRPAHHPRHPGVGQARPPRRGVLLAVEDAGVGVPWELQATLFEPFRQGPGASPHAPGVGIGLSLVARFAELHGGRAWVQDRPGGGASFQSCSRIRATGTATATEPASPSGVTASP
jgi:hypothetical protein